MSTAVALKIPEDQGLTDFETKLATALIHARYRSSFSNIHPRKTADGGTVLEIWGRTPADAPAFSLLRHGDSLVAVSERKGLVAASETVEELMTKIASELPPPLPY